MFCALIECKSVSVCSRVLGLWFCLICDGTLMVEVGFHGI